MEEQEKEEELDYQGLVRRNRNKTRKKEEVKKQRGAGLF